MAVAKPFSEFLASTPAIIPPGDFPLDSAAYTTEENRTVSRWVLADIFMRATHQWSHLTAEAASKLAPRARCRLMRLAIRAFRTLITSDSTESCAV
jgi:hypothetical protein